LLPDISYLHYQNIRYRDIKPENILIKGTNILFTDFGISFAGVDETKRTATSTQGTFKNEPPEAMGAQGQGETDEVRTRVGKKGDIWSLGCVFIGKLYASSRPSIFDSNNSDSRELIFPG
jgi:serine/threonine protein kinase